MGVLNQLGITEGEWMSFGSAAGMRLAIESDDRRILEGLRVAAKAAFGEELDVQSLLKDLEKVEAAGRIGQSARGTKLVALDRVLGDRSKSGMKRLGESVAHAPIAFNTDVDFQFQPVDSQRMLQWAARFGKQEKVVSVLAHLHFEKQESATNRNTLLKVAEHADLDVQAFERFLDSDELVAEVWKSYGDTIDKYGIHSIPLFIFNGPMTNGGPFRDGSSSATVVHGSANPEQFAAAFEEVLTRSDVSPRAALPGLAAVATATPPLDLAFGRPASASSSKSEERSAARAVDGRVDTRWTSAYSDNQWLCVDLGEIRTLTSVRIRWERAHARSYLVQGSVDGTSWETLASEAGREGWVTTELPEGPRARWVRMHGQERATEFGFSIWEMQVYGSEGSVGAAQVVAQVDVKPAVPEGTARKKKSEKGLKKGFLL